MHNAQVSMQTLKIVNNHILICEANSDITLHLTLYFTLLYYCRNAFSVLYRAI